MSWQRYRLKHLVQINARTLPEDSPEDREFRYIDISTVGRGRLVAEPQLVRFGDAPSRARRLVSVGDTIISTVRTYLRAVWPVAEPASDLVVSTGFAVLKPGPLIDHRFLGWWCQSDACVEAVVARSVGVSYPAVNPGDVAQLEIRLPALPEQSEIADFLDAETARIDALIEKKRRMLSLMDERSFALLSDVLSPAGCAFTRLGRFASVQTGLTVDGSRVNGEDVVTRPYLRVANVLPGRLLLDTVTEITVPRALAERATLRTGDVLMTEGGDLDKLGRGTVWRDEIPGCLHQNHVFAVRTDPRRLDGEYLALLTQTAHGRAYFERTGSQITNLASTSSTKVLDFPVPALPLERQCALVREASTATATLAHIGSRLTKQIELLREHRQALITAAVTGQLDVAKTTA